MTNLNTKSGENNCYYNISGRCTNPRGLAGESGRDWDSKQNCTFTQDGAQSLCSVYFFEGIYNETERCPFRRIINGEISSYCMIGDCMFDPDDEKKCGIFITHLKFIRQKNAKASVRNKNP